MVKKNRKTTIKIGDTFGYWTVISEPRGGKCLCRCQCGTERLVDSYSLGRCSWSCGCKSKEVARQRATEKMLGKTFGRLTVLERVENRGGKAYYKCRCSCGNEVIVRGTHLTSGSIVSCKCYNKERIHETSFKDLTGKRIGRLKVMGIVGQLNGQHLYKCKCDCGNEKILKGHDLTGSRPTLSCGCLHKEVSSKLRYKSLVGKKFGKLTVMERVENSASGETRYRCKCECGGEALVIAQNLKKASGTISCGCINSIGEYRIAQLLNRQGIRFEKQKTFAELKHLTKTRGTLRFDFYIPKENYIIEYDGVQHFKSGLGWDTEERVKETQRRDRIKNEFCKEQGIPIIRIPYTHLEDLCLNDLLLETSQFLLFGVK